MSIERRIGRLTVHLGGSAIDGLLGARAVRLNAGWCVNVQVWPRRFGFHVAWWRS